MSLREAYSISAESDLDGSGFPYSQSVNLDIPQPTLVDPQDVINQYYKMLENTGAPIEWIPREKLPEPDLEAEMLEPELPMPELKAEPPVNAPLAVYTSFVFPPMKTGEVGFKPQITVYDEAERTFLAKKLSEAHEAVHSSQFSGSAVLHAISLNARSPIVMRIREWVKMTVLTEAEAYAKTTLLAWALKHADNDVHYNQETRFDPVTVADFEQKLVQGHSVHDALVELAVAGMKKRHHINDVLDGGDIIGEREVPFAEYYAERAVADYNHSWRLNRKYVWQEFPYEIIRLEDRDYRSVKADFGPNIMPALVDHLDEMIGYIPKIEEKIADYEKKLAIYYPDRLRTFGQALQSMDMTEEEYINNSERPFQRDITRTSYFWHLVNPNIGACDHNPVPEKPCNLQLKLL